MIVQGANHLYAGQHAVVAVELSPVGWVSMWLPVMMGDKLLLRPARRMKPLPIWSMVTLMPASLAKPVTRSQPYL